MPKTNPIRVLIADDHAIVRAGLQQFLSEVDDIVVAGEAGSGTEALELIRKGGWDVVLLDIAMPDMTGIDVLKRLRRDKPELPVLILSIYPEEQYAVSMLRAGASGYMTKESAPGELVEAIRKVHQGRRYVSPSLAELLALEVGGDVDRPLHETLSEREFQIFSKLATGKTVSEVAQELFLSVKTISTYRARILDKMGMKNNAELTYYAIKNHLIE
ncbi:MAG TPA: response regulator transcription factor [Burkholderiales bacterium]|jgi:DNA-binding NarL/FixJ family response regulator|nr:response regulator transcription factor [Burkholderiales bacterium]